MQAPDIVIHSHILSHIGNGFLPCSVKPIARPLEFEQEVSGERLSTDEREELRRLRKENRELRMEQEILKKASAYFARQMK